MTHLFIYLLVSGSDLSLVRGGGYICKDGFGVVLAYMCYSCSNIEVVYIHIHASNKACSVKVWCPLSMPTIASTCRNIQLHRPGLCVYVWVCVALYTRASVSYDIVQDFLERAPLCFIARVFQHWPWPSVIAGSHAVSSARHGLWLGRKIEGVWGR